MNIKVLAGVFLVFVSTIFPMNNTEYVDVKYELIEEAVTELKIINVDSKDKPIFYSSFEIVDPETNELIKSLKLDSKGMADIRGLKPFKKYLLVQEDVSPRYEKFNGETYFYLVNNVRSIIKITNNPEYSELKPGEHLSVPTVLQNPELPNGCEVTSLTAVLQYYGLDVDKLVLSDEFLPKKNFYTEQGKLFGADPNKYFSGDPRSDNGWFSYAPVIEKAADAYLSSQGIHLNAYDMTGSSEEKIIEQLKKGIPIIVWPTIDMEPAKISYGWYLEESGEYIDVPINLHAVVLIGYSETKVHVMDPLEGKVIYDRQAFFNAYKGIGRRAIFFVK